MKRYVFLLSIVISSCTLAAQAGDPEQIVGVWKSSTAGLMIKIDKVGNYFQGRIVWLKAKGSNQLTLDENNPNEQLQKMPLKGNKILQELSFNQSEAVWDGGTFYNHEEGKLYNCHVTLSNTDQIKITRYNQSHQDEVVETWTRQ